jgi:tRNA threonylcarbamoyladenosine biosynthesis protein TsaE
MQITYAELSEIDRVAGQLITFAGPQKVWIFEGDMGAGKTTLIRSLCARWGVADNVTSPTFSLVNEYRAAGGDPVYHFDFYRIKNEAEALDMGAEEYFYSDHICLIEWPSKVAGLLPDTYFKVEIQADSSTQRTILLSHHER